MKCVIKMNKLVNEIKVYENDIYIQSITLGDFVEVIKNAVKMEWIIVTNGTTVDIHTRYRILSYKF